MAQPGVSQPPPSSLTTETTENPIVAVGRKVRSVLGSHQQPSVRILRESSSNRGSRRALASQGNAEKFGPHRNAQGPESRAELGEHSATHASACSAAPKGHPSANRIAGSQNRMRSWFSRKEDSTDDRPFEHEYDPDTVDLLIVHYKWIAQL